MPNIWCSICMNPLMKNDLSIVVTECGHLYHENCLTRWSDRTKKCPDCRTEFAIRKLKKVFPMSMDEDNEPEPLTEKELTKANENLTGRLLDKEKECEDLVYMYSVEQLRLGCLNTAYSEKVKKLKETEKVLTQRNKKITDSEKKLRAMQTELKEAKQSVQQKEKEHNGKLIGKDREIATLQKSNAKLMKAQDAFEERCSKLEAEVKRLEQLLKTTAIKIQPTAAAKSPARSRRPTTSTAKPAKKT